ncbi:MAG: RagB/SusD domain-containing [Prolixibacteraceae bacterium]|nr:MAG: RagB/SusD domain-containing [Prolixibacteraceae bacterium]
MKNIAKYLLLVFLSLATITSCYTEYLDPVPETSISDLVAFDTRDRILQQVTGLYEPFKNGIYLGGRYQVYNDIRGDHFLNLRENGVTGLETWKLNTAESTNEVINLWTQVYSSINRINVLLDGLEVNKAEIVPALLSQAEFDAAKGEALALRGIAYFHLSVLYARPYNQAKTKPNTVPGLVLRLTPQRSAADNEKARSSVEETFTQIVADLVAAEALLPAAAPTVAATRITRMNKITVNAFLTRVYLHMNNWPGVIAAGNKIVASSNAPFTGPGGVPALAPNFAAIFAAPYTSAEAIFSIPNIATELPGTQNQLGHYFSGRLNTGNQEYAIFEAGPLWKNTTDFPETDARRALTFVANFSGKPYRFIDKYTLFPHTDWSPVIRYAEVLLNIAEAEARNANAVNAKAVALLNAVYKRSNPTAADYSTTSFSSVDAFANRLLDERSMEFLGEGIRNMDIMRRVIDIPAKTGVSSFPPSSVFYIWPIPNNERNTNSLCVQNTPF